MSFLFFTKPCNFNQRKVSKFAQLCVICFIINNRKITIMVTRADGHRSRSGYWCIIVKITLFLSWAWCDCTQKEQRKDRSKIISLIFCIIARLVCISSILTKMKLVSTCIHSTIGTNPLQRYIFEIFHIFKLNLNEREKFLSKNINFHKKNINLTI